MTANVSRIVRSLAMLFVSMCMLCLGMDIANACTPTTYAHLLHSRTWSACATEDSNNCVWNARTHGNGHGVSFIAVQHGGVVLVYRSNGTHSTYPL